MLTIRNDKENLLLNKICDKDGLSINECVPSIEPTSFDVRLVWDASGNFKWVPDGNGSMRHLESLGLYLDDQRIGIGRKPLHNYKVDLNVPSDIRFTGLHIGDGIFGFSFGNGTFEGFVPEIIGMGSTENDAGLYFIGKTSSSLPSKIPLIVMDGRNIDNTALSNRPIFGITNGDYNNYKLVIGCDGNVGIGKYAEIYKLEVNGTIQAKDVVIDSSISLKNLQREVDDLKKQLRTFIENNSDT